MNRPHPHRRQDSRLIRMTDAEFEAECDRAFREGSALDAAERAARIQEYETSPEQADWDADVCSEMCGHDACNQYWESKGRDFYGDGDAEGLR